MAVVANRTNTKDEIRAHAERLLARYGYEGVSMRDIAGVVGVQQSAIYNHFASKQQLLVDQMVRHMEALLAAMRAAVDPAGTPAERLEAFARFHVDFQIDNSDAVFIAYMELRSLEPEGRETVVVLRDQYERSLRRILEDGVRDGVFDVADPAVVARGFLAMMTGVTVWFREDGPLTRREISDAYVSTVLRAVGLPKPS